MQQTLILTGPTAAGKTQLSLELADHYADLEIINADSLLVYRGMDIGTAKPTLEERVRVPHHLMDCVDPDQTFTAAEFVRQAQAAQEEIRSRGKRCVIVGGTGFYLKALLFGVWDAPPTDLALRAQMEGDSNEALFERLDQIDSAAAVRIGANDRYRLIRALEIFQLCGKTPTQLALETNRIADPQYLLWVIDRDSASLDERIHLRTQKMLSAEGTGVPQIIAEYIEVQKKFPTSRALKAIGYAQIERYLQKIEPQGRKVKPGIPGLTEEIELATRQLVKQQRTWFRNFQQKVAHVHQWQLDEDRAALDLKVKELWGS